MRRNSRATVVVHDAARGRRARQEPRRSRSRRPRRRRPRRRAADVLPLRPRSRRPQRDGRAGGAADLVFAEGYTGAGFDEYLIILNPTTTRGRRDDHLLPDRAAAPVATTLTVGRPTAARRWRCTTRPGVGREPGGVGQGRERPTAAASSSSGRSTSPTTAASTAATPSWATRRRPTSSTTGARPGAGMTIAREGNHEGDYRGQPHHHRGIPVLRRQGERCDLRRLGDKKTPIAPGALNYL